MRSAFIAVRSNFYRRPWRGLCASLRAVKVQRKGAPRVGAVMQTHSPYRAYGDRRPLRIRPWHDPICDQKRLTWRAHVELMSFAASPKQNPTPGVAAWPRHPLHSPSPGAATSAHPPRPCGSACTATTSRGGGEHAAHLNGGPAPSLAVPRRRAACCVVLCSARRVVQRAVDSQRGRLVVQLQKSVRAGLAGVGVVVPLQPHPLPAQGAGADGVCLSRSPSVQCSSMSTLAGAGAGAGACAGSLVQSSWLRRCGPPPTTHLPTSLPGHMHTTYAHAHGPRPSRPAHPPTAAAPPGPRVAAVEEQVHAVLLCGS